MPKSLRQPVNIASVHKRRLTTRNLDYQNARAFLRLIHADDVLSTLAALLKEAGFAELTAGIEEDRSRIVVRLSHLQASAYRGLAKIVKGG